MPRLRLRHSGSFVGMAGMAVVGYMYAGLGLVAPLWAVLVLCLVWVALLLLGFRWFSRFPLRVLALPVVALALWVGALTAGGYLLGWTA